MFGCEFNTQVDGSIVTYGKGHINFWTLEGSQLAKKQGLFEVHREQKLIPNDYSCGILVATTVTHFSF